MAGIQEFDYSVDLSQVLIWQRDNAVRLQSLLSSKQAWQDANQRDFWSNWYDDVFNLQTANDFGLSVWAIILGLPLVVSTSSGSDRPVIGFGAHYLNFHESNFADDETALELTTEEKRLVLRLRYLQLVSDCCPESINEALNVVFSDMGRVYVLDGLDMTCEYVFLFLPPPRVLGVLATFDILPRPAGVKIRVQINPQNVFGFGPFYLNFHNSNFGGGS